MVEAILKELAERLNDPQCKHTHLGVAHTQNPEAAEEFKKEIEAMFPHADVVLAPLSLSVSCHIGPGSLAITATRKLVEEDENTPN